MKKIALIILLIVSLVIPLLSDSLVIKLPKPVTLKLINGKKYKTHILCFTDKGFVTWNSTVFNPEENFENYAEYYSYSQLDYIKVDGSLSLWPLAIGSSIAAISILSYDSGNNSEDFGPLILASLSSTVGVLWTLLTPLVPRSFCPMGKYEAEKIPEKYYLYKDNIPEVVSEFIAEYEK